VVQRQVAAALRAGFRSLEAHSHSVEVVGSQARPRTARRLRRVEDQRSQAPIQPIALPKVSALVLAQSIISQAVVEAVVRLAAPAAERLGITLLGSEVLAKRRQSQQPPRRFRLADRAVAALVAIPVPLLRLAAAAAAQ
jgi:hypothetical protein